MRMNGLSEVIGSWKIIPMRLPRSARISFSESDNRLRPLKITSPPTMRPGGLGISRMIDRLVTDFPDPDSPTMPSVSPRCRSKLTPSTARTVFSSSAKYVRRFLTESSITRAASPLPHLRIERVAQAIAEEIEREERDGHRHTGTNELPGKQRDVLNAVGGETAPGRQRRLHAEAQE